MKTSLPSFFTGIKLAMTLFAVTASGLAAAPKVDQVTDGNVQKRMLHDFKKVMIEGNYELHIKDHQDTLLQIEGDPASFELLSSRVSSETLTIKPKKARKALKGLNDYPVLKITLLSPSYEEISVVGSHQLTGEIENSKNITFDLKGNISALLDIQSEETKIRAWGNYNVKLDGYSKESTILFNGTGDVQASNFSTDECKVTHIGSGEIRINVLDKLQGKMIGSGRLIFSGNPKHKITTVGQAQAIASESDSPQNTLPNVNDTNNKKK